MAKKQAYKIDRFEGGLNNALHSSKIKDDELAELVNLVIKAGSIAPPPSATETFLQDYGAGNYLLGNFAGEIAAGTGLYYFRSDYEMLDQNNDNPDGPGAAFLEDPQPIDGGVGYWVIAKQGDQNAIGNENNWIWIYDSHNEVWSYRLKGHFSTNDDQEGTELDIIYIGESLRICETNFKRNESENFYRCKLFKRRYKYLDRIASPFALNLEDYEQEPDEDAPVIEEMNFISNRDPEDGSLLPYNPVSDWADWAGSDNWIENYSTETLSWIDEADAIESCTLFKGQMFDKPNEGWGCAGGSYVIPMYSQYDNYHTGNGPTWSGFGVHPVSYSLEIFQNNSYATSMGGYYSGYNSMNSDIGGGSVTVSLGGSSSFFALAGHPTIGTYETADETGSCNNAFWHQGTELSPYYQPGTKNVKWDFLFKLLHTSRVDQDNLDATDIGVGTGAAGIINSNLSWIPDMFWSWGKRETSNGVYNGLTVTQNYSGGPDLQYAQHFIDYRTHCSHDLGDTSSWQDAGFFTLQGNAYFGCRFWLPIEEVTGGSVTQYGDTNYDISTRKGFGLGVGKVSRIPDDIETTGTDADDDNDLIDEYDEEAGATYNMLRGHWHYPGDADPGLLDSDWGSDYGFDDLAYYEDVFCGGASVYGDFNPADYVTHGFQRFDREDIYGDDGIPVLNGLNENRYVGWLPFTNNYAPTDINSLSKRESLIYFDLTHGKGRDEYPGTTPIQGTPLRLKIEWRAWFHQYLWGTQAWSPGSVPYNNSDEAQKHTPVNMFSDSSPYAGYRYNPEDAFGEACAYFKIVLWKECGNGADDYDRSHYPIVYFQGSSRNDLMTMQAYINDGDEYEDYSSTVTYETPGVLDIDFNDPDQNPWETYGVYDDIDMISIHCGGSCCIDLFTGHHYNNWESNNGYGPHATDVDMKIGSFGPVVAIKKVDLNSDGVGNVYNGPDWIVDPYMVNPSLATADGGWYDESGGSNWSFALEADGINDEVTAPWGLPECGDGAWRISGFVDTFADPLKAKLNDSLMIDIPSTWRIQGYFKAQNIKVEIRFHSTGDDWYILREIHGSNGDNWVYFSESGYIENSTDYTDISITVQEQTPGAHDPGFILDEVHLNGTTLANLQTPLDMRYPTTTTGWQESTSVAPDSIASTGDWISVIKDQADLTDYLTDYYLGDTTTNEGMQDGKLEFHVSFVEGSYNSGGWGTPTFMGFDTMEEAEDSGLILTEATHVRFGVTTTDFTDVENEPSYMTSYELDTTKLYNLDLKVFFTPLIQGTVEGLSEDDSLQIPADVKKASLYYQIQDVSDEWFKLCEVDVDYGIMSEGDDSRDYKPFCQVDNTATVLSTSNSLAKCDMIIKAPTPKTFRMSSGYDVGTNLNVRWRTSALVGRHMYVGNVAELDPLTNMIAATYSSRILKSPAARYDTLPVSNFIDVGMNDGDPIVKLIGYRTNLLVFKKRRMYVISTSGGAERLLSTFEGYGVLGPESVTLTPYGVVFVNNNGLFIYTGKDNVIKLSHYKIKDRDFAIHRSETDFNMESSPVVPIVIFNGSENKLFIEMNANLNEGDKTKNIVYDFTTKSFSKIDGEAGLRAPVSTGEAGEPIKISNAIDDDKGVPHVLVYNENLTQTDSIN